MYQDSDGSGRERRIAIVGGGFSGTLLAINLLRFSDAHVQLVERDPDKLGRGLAYGTDNPEHVLNVRASNMSAFPDALDHFTRWLGEAEGPNRFVPRRTYGRYLAEQLQEAQAAAPGRLALVDGQVVAAERSDEGWVLVLASGGSLRADMLVLAQGNMTPAPLPELERLGSDIYFASPWAQRPSNRLGRDDAVLLIGTGLTAVDAVLSLDAEGFEGHVTALSRRGLRPRPHALNGPHVDRRDRLRAEGSALVRAVRDRAAAIGWRAAVDELRPYTQDIWRTMDAAGRRRFLRHLRPYWDAHRHRLAPSVDHRISALQMDARLSFVAGKIVAAERVGEQARVTWRVRGTDLTRTETVRRVINCTGPSGQIASCPDPLLRHLLARGWVRQDALGLGIDVDRQGQVQDAAGAAQPSLLAVGPMTRAEGWEIVAVPDIRRQVWDVARRLGHAQWVAGEGL